MRGLVILAIRGYQRFVSPYKGFSCAYRVHTGRCSCSEFGRRAVERKGVFTGLLLIDARLQRCGSTHRLRSQQGVIDCDCGFDFGNACDCADACSTGCDAADACSGCDWRSRRRDKYEVKIEPLGPFNGRKETSP